MNGPGCGGCQHIEDGYFSKGWLLITLPDGALQEHACWEHARGWKMEREGGGFVVWLMIGEVKIWF